MPSPRETLAASIMQTRPPRQDQLDALARREIPLWGIAGRPGTGEFPATFARVAFDPVARRFEFDPGGTHVMVAVALNAFCEPCDLVAWTLRGDRIASWCGAVSMLGAQHVTGPRMGGALMIFPDAFAWMRGERLGVVVIDPDRAARELHDCGPFRAADTEHGLRLEALLTPRMPSIVVHANERQKVAA